MLEVLLYVLQTNFFFDLSLSLEGERICVQALLLGEKEKRKKKKKKVKKGKYKWKGKCRWLEKYNNKIQQTMNSTQHREANQPE